MFSSIFTFIKLSYLFNNILLNCIGLSLIDILHRLVFFRRYYERIDYIKSVCRVLERYNILYVKLFQSIAIDKLYLTSVENNFLIKYTDNVPYNQSDIDWITINSLIKNYNIKLLDSNPINSGIVACVFDAEYNCEKVVIKILKNDIDKKLDNFFSEIELLVYMSQFIPYIKNFKLRELFSKNKLLLLSQLDFKNEVNNLQRYKKNLENFNEYKIPSVYSDITQKYNNIIVMENIRGYTYSEIKEMKPDIQDNFGELALKLGYISILLTSSVNCDLHSGNLFFYIDKHDNINNKKYKLGIIDFGICYFPNVEDQIKYFNFFNKFLLTKDYSNLIDNSIGQFIEPKEVLNNMSLEMKNKLEKEIIYGVTEYAEKFLLAKYFRYINITLDKYNLILSSNFQKIALSIQIGVNIAKTLCKDLQYSEKKLFREIADLFNIINIDE